jgi:hypothetical protein
MDLVHFVNSVGENGKHNVGRSTPAQQIALQLHETV